jgi:cyanophycin synthetase
MARANPGDVVVLCVDQHAEVLAELEQMTKSAQAGAHLGTGPGDPDLDPAELQSEAQVAGDDAAAAAEVEPATA